MSAFGVILVCIFPNSDWIRKMRTGITPNTDAFHAVMEAPWNSLREFSDTASVQIRSFFWSSFFYIRTEYDLRIQSEYKKIRTKKKTPYLDTFDAVWDFWNSHIISSECFILYSCFENPQIWLTTQFICQVSSIGPCFSDFLWF